MRFSTAVALTFVFFACSAFAVDLSTTGSKKKAAETGAQDDAAAKFAKILVYTNKTGKVYHVAGCSSLKEGSTEYKILDAIAAGYTPCSKCSAPVVVFGTKSGKKYHSFGCDHLKSSSIPYLLADALAAGMTACSKCSPPADPNAAAPTPVTPTK